MKRNILAAATVLLLPVVNAARSGLESAKQKATDKFFELSSQAILDAADGDDTIDTGRKITSLIFMGALAVGSQVGVIFGVERNARNQTASFGEFVRGNIAPTAGALVPAAAAGWGALLSGEVSADTSALIALCVFMANDLYKDVRIAGRAIVNIRAGGAADPQRGLLHLDQSGSLQAKTVSTRNEKAALWVIGIGLLCSAGVGPAVYYGAEDDRALPVASAVVGVQMVKDVILFPAASRKPKDEAAIPLLQPQGAPGYGAGGNSL